jgi:hypothetical protein
MDFTDVNILSVFTKGITVKKNLKQSTKNDGVPFLPTELLTEFILSVKSIDKFVGKL